ncbi:MAG: hypothetical protein A6F71_09220 [Cycloclasticus sp. symbiont of Poecilosclerida sp. M]|nr:MAG: hypothetical protein A6F71_09220 [Cycloclasticus sp. symbiont of Poecilosclerida sp. M]
MWNAIVITLTCSEKYGATVGQFPLLHQSLQSWPGKQLKLISSSRSHDQVQRASDIQLGSFHCQFEQSRTSFQAGQSGIAEWPYG